MTDLERRTLLTPKVEFRAATDDEPPKVEGYAAVYNQQADIAGWFLEEIQEGAFDDSIKEDNVAFLIEHDGLPLARSGSGTLELSSDNHGLKMASELNADDPDVQRIVPKMDRGDLDKMSIGFRVLEQKWTYAQEKDEMDIRTIIKAQLFDVSIVTFPAFDGTEIALRSRGKSGVVAAKLVPKRVELMRARQFQAERNFYHV